MMNKKLAVFASVVSLAAASLTTPVLAASSISEVLNSNLKETLEQAKDEEFKLPAGVSLGLKLTAEDSAKAMLGMMAPVDISWLESAGISLEAGAKDKNGVGSLTASVNDIPIVSANALMDTDTETVYLQAPELSETCLKATVSELAEMLGAETGASVDEETKEIISAIAANLSAYSFDPDTMIDILEDVYAIMFEAYVDDGSEEDTITAGGISQDATKLMGHMDGQSAIDMVEKLFIYVRDSKELEDIYTAAVDGIESAPSFGDIQTSIDNMLPELTSAEEEIPMLAEMTVWVDENDKVIGSQSSSTSDTQTMTMRVLTTADGDAHGFDMNADIKTEDTTISINIDGVGEVSNSLLSGSYAVSVGGTEFAAIKVTDYDVDAAEKGYINGTYDFSFNIPDDFQNGALSILNNFGLTAAIASDESGCSADLTVSSGGAALATLSVNGSLLDEVKGLDPAVTESAVSLSEGLQDYMSSINLSQPLEALTSAGMPEDFIENISGLLG